MIRPLTLACLARQMLAVIPAALTPTAIGAGPGRPAPGALMNVRLRRGTAALCVGCGIAPGTAPTRA